MKNEARQPCALRARFTTKGHEQQAAAGLGFCTGYEVYVRADNPPTVLFKPAPAGQIGERKAYLAQHTKATRSTPKRRASSSKP